MRYFAMLAFLICVAGGQGFAANVEQPIVYPKNGQNPQQQGSDANACQVWAQQTTGVNLAYLQGQLSVAQSQNGTPQQRPIVRGAVRGVAVGSALGAINKNMDSGAGKGATMGVTAGAMRGVGQRIDMARDSKAQQSQQQVQQLQNQYTTYNRAFSACMSGKGYSVS
jgi:hypothetical protein